jgi:hypothetical protein
MHWAWVSLDFGWVTIMGCTVTSRFYSQSLNLLQFRVFWDVASCSYVLKLTNVSEMCTALIMEAVCTSETSVNFNVTTWRYILEDITTSYSLP